MPTYDSEPSQETTPKSKKQKVVKSLTFHDAIELGEYDPEFLGTFPEWHTFPKHTQFEFIRQALDNRYRQLQKQWAEVVNVLNFSKKPHLKEALKNIQDQIHKVDEDREKLYLEYSKA